MTAGVLRGSAALHDLLANRVSDIREVEVPDFAAWLERHLEHWRQNPLFLQRSAIRELRLAHPELQALEEERARLQAAYESSPLCEPLESARRDLAGAENAVAGLTHALGRAGDAAERRRLIRKREEFLARVEQQRTRVRELVGESKEAARIEQINERLDALREHVGFHREISRLEKMQRKRGRASGRSGASFERAAREAIGTEVVPELTTSTGAEEIVVLQGVTLAAARTEIDQLLVQPGAAADEPVKVLGLVEAKRNPNDLARGLSKRLENLAWLAGHEPGYEAEVYTTRTYTSGHFEGQASHDHNGRRFFFTADSFRQFLPDLDSGELPPGLYLVSRPDMLWGLGSGGMARIAHRVATDLKWDPGDEVYLADLLTWCQKLAKPMETPELLRRYAADEEISRSILLIDD